MAEDKRAARKAAFARRAAAFEARLPGAADRLAEVLSAHRGATVAGYLPIRTEIDPLPAMVRAAAHGPVAVPLIDGPGRPLRFARWSPGIEMVEGPFGTRTPVAPEIVEPDVLIVPLVAFTRGGARLGYGGGFYDRTLALLRARRPTRAIGFAFAAQEAESLPVDDTDAPLDLVVTEAEIILPA
ncbi:5-formyltetrahydrofolate cyclo-ligase [Roseivivax isoporae LMG 25204]|uniref:5-formyltetrahydrofolate cyclo-ligase n=1 Tax=Roseivivax isoporae LMG 25204 TaxID=1449351 RepID=X7FAT9_9RHOB|nr:5-formyltetrahydrofolate cyclo-ligase [Roseivivax isoporae LMG 25204]